MEGAERDDTQDWLLPEAAVPPLLSELESRIDEALIVAKASEKAAIEIGDAALDAAAQARRAADLAERASRGCAQRQRRRAWPRCCRKATRTPPCAASASGPTGWWRGCGRWNALPIGRG